MLGKTPLRISLPLFLFFSISTTVLAQRPYWEMMHDSVVDYAATLRAFEKYWEGKTPEKGQGYKVFQRWAYHNGLRVRPDGTLPPAGYEAQEFERWQREEGNQRRSNLVTSGNWVPMGPIVFPTNNTGQPAGIGRMTTIAFHPTLANKLYAGSANGGMWVSNDNGTTWAQNNTDFNPTLGVSAIVVDPLSPSTIYIGTGDKDGGDASGLGVYKTTNDGTTWTVSNTGMGNRTVHCLAMDPNDNTKLLASTSNGIYRSLNSGANWTQVLASGTTYEIRYRPGSNSVLYAVNATQFYTSTDDGATWTGVVVATSARTAFAITPADPNLVFLVKDVGINPVFKSTDGGATFTNVQTDGKVLLNGNCAGTGTGGQGWYDICISIDPTNVNTVHVGGVSLWRSTDGGVTFSINACWSSMGTNVHADHHWLAYSPHFPARLYNCNDGGIYYTDNGTSYTNISSGLATSLIYRIGVSSNDPDMLVGGFQDNGMIISRQPNWIITVGGDGLDCAIDPTDNNFQYGSYVNGVMRRSTNAGYNWSTISGGISETGPWLSPYALQPGNPNVMLAGYVSIWRSTNVKSASPTWTNVFTLTGSTITDVHWADANTAYASRSNGAFYQSVDAGLTWVAKTNTPGGVADDIAADPLNPNTVWVASGNDIYRSLDGGTTWALWDTGLPNIEALTVVYDKVANALYCGMWTGVYYRHVTDASWVAFKTDLPNTQAHHLQIFYGPNGCVGRDKLRLATYGRGVWESDLRAGPTMVPVACFGTEKDSACVASEAIMLYDSSAYDPTSWLWTITGPGTVTFTGGTSNTSQNPQVILGTPGLYTVTLLATNVNGSDTRVRTNYIRGVNPTTRFASADTLIYQGQTANFTDQSSSCATSWLWDFGDGFTSTLQNPSHIYATAGLYNVSLTINGGAGFISRTGYIQVLPHLPVPYTSATIGWTGDMETDFTAWHFGDKRMSGALNPWERGSVTLTFPAAASGLKCWATDLDANLPQATYSTSVYTPTFDMSAAGTYQVRLKTAMQSVFCNAPIGVVLDYTTNQGATWTRLGDKQGTDPNAQFNWFTHGGTGGCDNIDVVPAPRIGWNYSGTATFRQAIYDASALAGNARVGFRLAFYSSAAYGAFTSKGFAFDDFELDFAPSPIVTDTIPGSLVSFDGTNDYVETYYPANLSTFTIEGWVMAPAAPAGTARTSIVQKTNVLELSWNHPTGASRGAVAMRNSGGTWQNFSFGTLNANTWYHLAVVFDGTNVTTYKNGVLATTGAFSGTLTTNTNTWQLGNAAGSYFSGQLDEFRIWNIARSQLQVREAMHRTLDPAECGNVVLYYQSNETSGYLRDAVRLRNGYLMNGLGRTLSPIAVGRGVSQSLTVGGTGMQSFGIPLLDLDFVTAAGTPFDVTVTRINQFVNQQTPNPSWNAPPNAALVDNNPFFYHVVNKFGGGAFSVNATVNGVPGISPAEAATPSSLKWVKRVSNSVGVWDLGIPATSATVSSGFNGTVTFMGVNTFSQAFIGSEIMDGIFPLELSLVALPDAEHTAIQVLWNTADANGLIAWTLERAHTPADFAQGEFLNLANLPITGTSALFEDEQVELGQTYYYRVGALDQNQNLHYSNIVEARLDQAPIGLRVVPNPNQGIFFADVATKGGPIKLSLTNSAGQIVWEQNLPDAAPVARHRVDPGKLPAGLYFLTLASGSHRAQAKVVIMD